MKRSHACQTGMRGQTPEAALLASSNTTGLCATLTYASEKWSRAKILREQRGRPPKRAKSVRWRSQQQRAFAACVLHSVRIYEHLGPAEQEIRAMLHARGMIDATKAQQSSDGVGVRPSGITDAAAAAQWLDENVYVAGSERRAHKEHTALGQRRLCLPSDAVAARRAQGGQRILIALAQLVDWVFLWSDERFELRWLGLAVGFGVFAACAVSQPKTAWLQGVADYDVRDPHATIQLHAAKCARDQGDSTADIVSVYGPVALINAACRTHACVALVDEDLGVSGKRVKARFLRCVRAGSQVLAAYCAPRGQSWHCPGLAPARQCNQLTTRLS